MRTVVVIGETSFDASVGEKRFRLNYYERAHPDLTLQVGDDVRPLSVGHHLCGIRMDVAVWLITLSSWVYPAEYRRRWWDESVRTRMHPGCKVFEVPLTFAR